MKKVWNKETRREDNSYYRQEDWGIEVEDDFSDPNFTETSPPDDAFNGVAYDWNETTQSWDIDDSVGQEYYMTMMRKERDKRIQAIMWRVERHTTQVNGSITPTDDDTKMNEIYTYLQNLRDMPQNNIVSTQAGYDALTWPTEPA